MQTKDAYPMYIAPFGDRWVVKRRKNGGIIKTADSREKIKNIAKQEAHRYARIYGVVKIWSREKDDEFHPYETVTERGYAGQR